MEAGLEAMILRMPEEHNRRLTDHISEYLFAPTERAKANLVKGECLGQNLPYRQHSHRRSQRTPANCRKKIEDNGADPFQNLCLGNSS